VTVDILERRGGTIAIMYGFNVTTVTPQKSSGSMIGVDTLDAGLGAG